MSNTMLVILIFLPVILAVAASVICWRTLSRPFLFLVAAVLSLGGMQALIAPVAFSIMLPGMGSLQEAATDGAFVQTHIVSTGVQVTLGLAFLWWLYRGLRKPLK